MDNNQLNLTADIQTFKNLQSSLVPRILTVLKDKSIDLETRWDLLKQSYKLLPDTESSDGYTFIISNNISLYDEFYIDRYQTAEFIVLYENMADKDYPKEKVDEWREFVLDKGCGSFTCDW